MWPEFVEKLLTVIRRPYEIDGHDFMVSASIGISIFDGDDQHQNELLMNADAAMHHAKSLGRDRYCFFEASMNANAQQQMQLLHDLRLALERREFLLLYQPKFDALTMALTGVIGHSFLFLPVCGNGSINRECNEGSRRLAVTIIARASGRYECIWWLLLRKLHLGHGSADCGSAS